MNKIKQIRFIMQVLMPGYQSPEYKQLDASDKLQIEHSDNGVLLTWNEHKLEDQTEAPNKNVKCSTFVPMHMIHQIMFENEIIPKQPAPVIPIKKAGRPKANKESN
jgi:hypothetical protein